MNTRAELMLASAGDDAFVDGRLARERDDWQLERKLDGYRLVAIGVEGRVVLRTRNGVDATRAYPEVAAAFADQPYDSFVVDGEVVADPDVDADVPAFERLQGRPAIRPATDREIADDPVVFVAFDLLTLDGVDVRGISLDRRRGLLADAFHFGATLRLSTVIDGDGRSALDAACADGWEGLIAKRRATPYRGGRSRDWLKLKCLQRDEFVVIGMTAPKGTRSGFGALVVATDDGDGLTFAGRVGTGFDQATIAALTEELEAIRVDEPPAAGIPRELRSARWVEPRMVCEVGFAEWTSSGQLRHPRYLGRRHDKTPDQVRRERPMVEVALSNLDKILFPDIEGTKGEMVAHYGAVADRMLRSVVDRPLVLERFPNGVGTKGFYQKNTPDHVPDYISRLEVGSKSRDRIVYSVIHDANGLIYLANQGTIVFHTLLSAAEDTDRPIEVMWDLDPSGDDVASVQLAARMLRERLDDLGLAPRVKTSGSKGLHLHVDVIDDADAEIGYGLTRAFAHRLAEEIVAAEPERFTLEFSKKERRGRLFVDVLRNGHASHAAAPYSLRANSVAGVAAPISWDEALADDFHPRMITMRSMADRLAADIDPWRDHPPPESTIVDAARTLLG